MRKELDKMVAEKTPVTEPTDWVSSLLAILKKDGSVRIFLDPKDLNNAILIAFCLLPIAHCPLLIAHFSLPIADS